MKKISESEQEIMMAIWNAENKNSITASYLEEVFGEKKGWKKTSILTFLSRLVEKGYLSCEKTENLIFMNRLYLTKNFREERVNIF